jgi:hypothetical protein
MTHELILGLYSIGIVMTGEMVLFDILSHTKIHNPGFSTTSRKELETFCLFDVIVQITLYLPVDSSEDKN